MMKILDFNPASLFVFTLIIGILISVILAIYQAIEARRIEKEFESIAEFDPRYKAICEAWRNKHPIMPRTGPDVGYFIGLGFVIPFAIFVAATMFFS